MIFFGEDFRRATKSYIAHYPVEQDHPGMQNRLLQIHRTLRHANGPIRRSARLGGLLSFHFLEAA
jgi:hypothetical protein